VATRSPGGGSAVNGFSLRTISAGASRRHAAHAK
jgi:hypothetical protein